VTLVVQICDRWWDIPEALGLRSASEERRWEAQHECVSLLRGPIDRGVLVLRTVRVEIRFLTRDPER